MIYPPIEQQITFLHTRDLAGTAHFYEEVLGLSLALDQGDCRIYRVCGGAHIGFCKREEIPESTTGIILTLVTPEVDTWHQHLKEQGVTFEKPPTLNDKYGIYHCLLRDPNGYLIEIQRFLDPAWAAP
ncbi:MAG: VOC family protein [Anaerolineae bacterium]|jgi:catechol 2,3-dioxygenase-like lactoylglutathione lyase family enzyme